MRKQMSRQIMFFKHHLKNKKRKNKLTNQKMKK